MGRRDSSQACSLGTLCSPDLAGQVVRGSPWGLGTISISALWPQDTAGRAELNGFNQADRGALPKRHTAILRNSEANHRRSCRHVETVPKPADALAPPQKAVSLNEGFRKLGRSRRAPGGRENSRGRQAAKSESLSHAPRLSCCRPVGPLKEVLRLSLTVSTTGIGIDAKHKYPSFQEA